MKNSVIEGMVLMAMNYMSNLIEAGLPDSPTEKQLVEIEDASCLLYVGLDTYGERLAAQTTNPYDDKAVDESKEACINAAEKYGFKLYKRN